MFVNRDVIFYEHHFPFEQAKQRSSSGLDVLSQPTMALDDGCGSNEEVFILAQNQELVENMGSDDALLG